MAIDDLTKKIALTFSNNISRRRFIKLSVGAVACVSLSLLMFGCSGGDSTQRQEGYPISSEVYTTRQRAIVPDSVTSAANTILPWEPSKFKENGYGLWHYGPGIDNGKDPRIMPAGYNISYVINAASLLSFFTISDTHVYDKESPSQPFYVLKNHLSSEENGIPAITYTMLYTTHILDAAIQTVNALHKQKPFDCGLFLGDAANNSQHNEVRWYIDVIDGKFITPSSGAHAGADTIDYQKPYKAAGLDKTIPWYQTKGSHDNFWFGSNLVDDYLRQSYIGEDILILGDGFVEPPISGPTYYMGTIDGSTPYGNIIGAGQVGAISATKVAADPNRYSLNMKDWMREFFDTSSNPVGHGFTRTNIDNDFASYSFEPKSNIPIKIIMLDDTQSEQSGQDSNPPNPPANYGNGSLDLARFNWLIRELDKGQAEGKLMIIAAHVPIGVVPPPGTGTGSWEPKGLYSYVNDADLIATLQNKYSNLILWLAGHQHNNQVTPFQSPDPKHPEFGFWEVQTASLRDFPQQFRTFDIVRNTDNTISIIITNVDQAVRKGSPAAMSRFYAIAARELYNTPTTPSTPTSTYNAELIKQLSPEMQTKIQNYGTLISK
jgi:metallophosphoesterase (TIGR03768 family)